MKRFYRIVAVAVQGSATFHQYPLKPDDDDKLPPPPGRDHPLPPPPDMDGMLNKETPSPYTAGLSDEVKVPEYDTKWGMWENRPPQAGHPGVARYHGAKPREPPVEKVKPMDWRLRQPIMDHNAEFELHGNTGQSEGFNAGRIGNYASWDPHAAALSLYRACLKGLPLVKMYYWITISLDQMKQRVRQKFELNKYTKDPDALRHLLHCGWLDYEQCICFRKNKGHIRKLFGDTEDYHDVSAEYLIEEKEVMDQRAFWNGEEQRKEGPYDGFWSQWGKDAHEQYERLKGRIPESWVEGKGYFEDLHPDGTKYWEKNLDYEGWYMKNVDPDRANARKEMQNWIESGYNQPRHQASKNRRSYRRYVKDINTALNKSTQELYAANREYIFQGYTRENCPEANRVNAEKKTAMMDDLVFSSNSEEIDAVVRQAAKEFPNPRLWRTDAFYLRVRALIAHAELNWAKAPIGVALEKHFNEWVSLDANYTIYNSPEYEEIKADKKRNPMAKSWAEFYKEFDPDVPETRCLPWVHREFNYDRRTKWDERCMRCKKWANNGDIDFTRPFFDAIINAFEQQINRPETWRHPWHLDMKYSAPRHVQLYRSFNLRMDIALVNQMREFMKQHSTNRGAVKDLENPTVEETKQLLTGCDWHSFVFAPPPVVYPDGFEQAALNFDGSILRATTVA